MNPEPFRKSPMCIVLMVAVAVLGIATVTLAVLYGQASQNLEAQKATVATLQMDIAKEASHAAELKSDLNAARTTAETLATKSAQLKSEVESKEQDLAAEKAKTESTQAALEQEKAELPAVPVRIQCDLPQWAVDSLPCSPTHQHATCRYSWLPATQPPKPSSSYRCKSLRAQRLKSAFVKVFNLHRAIK